MANENLISLSEVKKKLTAIRQYFSGPPSTEQDKLARAVAKMCLEEVKKIKPADAVEVVHGYWIDSYCVDYMGRIVEHGIDCSVCESVFKDDSREVVKRWKERFKVCPFCGAVMDGERRTDV